VVAAAAFSGLAVYFLTNSDSSPASSAAATTKSKPSAPQAPQVGLAALIPKPLFKNSCTVLSAPLVAGAVQSASCTPPTNAADRKLPFYPDRWDVSIFPDQAALDSAYSALRRQTDTGQNFGACNNVTWGGESPWIHGPGKPGGRLFCYFEGNVAVIVWTHNKIGGSPPAAQADHIDMLATAREGGSDHPALFNWWRFWHHKIGKCQEEGCVAQLP
jgi:hypothetical protein